MIKIKLRTKIEIICAIFLLMFLAAVSVASLTRTISDSADNSYTFIRNSNGNYWVATATNIQLAINDVYTNLTNNRGTVWLPAGTLTITAQITLRSNVELVGCGVNVTRIYSDQSGSFIPFILNGINNVTIRDLTIDMHSQGSNGIYITGASQNIRVEDVSIENAGFQGIYVTDNCRFLYISNVKVKHGSITASHGFGLLNMYDSTIDNCIFENYHHDASEDGIDISHCENVTMSNIIIRGAGWHDAIKTIGSKKIVLSNIIIKDSYNYGLKLQTNTDISIDNFYIENTGTIGVACFSDSNGINLNNGYIKRSGSTGINIEAVNVSCSNIEIDGSLGGGISISSSNIQLTNIRIIKAQSYNKMNSARNVLISNCMFLYGSDMGLSIDDSTNFKIMNCIFEGNIGDGIDTTISACNNYSIIGCTFKNNAQGIDCHANDDWNMITLNTFIGDTLDDHFKSKGYAANNIGDDI